MKQPYKPQPPFKPHPPAKPVKPAKAEEGPVRAASLLEDRRRSQRVMLRMAVVLHVTGTAREVSAMTVAVSENGAMLLSQEALPVGTKVVVENPKTQNRADASVTRAAQVTAEGALLPVEFVQPVPAFWQVYFPPAAS